MSSPLKSDEPQQQPEAPAKPAPKKSGFWGKLAQAIGIGIGEAKFGG